MYTWGFPGGTSGKELTCQFRCKKRSFSPWVRKVPRVGNPLQYSSLENSMDGGAWQATVQGVSKHMTEQTRTHTRTHAFI